MIKETINALFAQHPSTGGCRVRLLGIRGGGPINALGVYDDIIYRCIGDDFNSYQASVDPGFYYIQHPIHPDGCFQLAAGLHWFEFGLHHGHDALVQHGDFIGWRLDTEGNRKFKGVGEAVNNHSGGSEEEVGKWSAGCQIIKSSPAWGPEWLDYFSKIKHEAISSYQNLIPYLLVENLPALPVKI